MRLRGDPAKHEDRATVHLFSLMLHIFLLTWEYRNEGCFRWCFLKTFWTSSQNESTHGIVFTLSCSDHGPTGPGLGSTPAISNSMLMRARQKNVHPKEKTRAISLQHVLLSCACVKKSFYVDTLQQSQLLWLWQLSILWSLNCKGGVLLEWVALSNTI